MIAQEAKDILWNDFCKYGDNLIWRDIYNKYKAVSRRQPTEYKNEKRFEVGYVRYNIQEK